MQRWIASRNKCSPNKQPQIIGAHTNCPTGRYATSWRWTYLWRVNKICTIDKIGVFTKLCERVQLAEENQRKWERLLTLQWQRREFFPQSFLERVQLAEDDQRKWDRLLFNDNDVRVFTIITNNWILSATAQQFGHLNVSECSLSHHFTTQQSIERWQNQILLVCKTN